MRVENGRLLKTQLQELMSYCLKLRDLKFFDKERIIEFNSRGHIYFNNHNSDAISFTSLAYDEDITSHIVIFDEYVITCESDNEIMYIKPTKALEPKEYFEFLRDDLEDVAFQISTVFPNILKDMKLYILLHDLGLSANNTLCNNEYVQELLNHARKCYNDVTGKY